MDKRGAWWANSPEGLKESDLWLSNWAPAPDRKVCRFWRLTKYSQSRHLFNHLPDREIDYHQLPLKPSYAPSFTSPLFPMEILPPTLNPDATDDSLPLKYWNIAYIWKAYKSHRKLWIFTKMEKHLCSQHSD